MTQGSTAFGLLGSIIQAQRDLVGSGPDLSSIARVATERAQSIVKADGAALWLREGSALVCTTAIGTLEGAGVDVMALSEQRVAEVVARGGDEVAVDNTGHLHALLQSVLVAPLLAGNAVIGALQVVASRPKAFDRGDVMSFGTISGFVGEATWRALETAQARRQFQLFEGAFVHSAVGMALVALDGRFLRVNEALCKLLGLDERALLERRFQDVTHPDDHPRDLERAELLKAGHIDHYSVERRYLHESGEMLWGHVTVTLVRTRSGKPAHYLTQVYDITPRKLAEANAAAFFDMSPDLLAITRGGRLEAVNASWETKLGISRAELLEKPFASFVHPEDLPSLDIVQREFARNQPVLNFRHRFRINDGSYRWLEWSTRARIDGRHYALARDVTAQVERVTELHQMASVDALTGLRNRRSFDKAVERALEASGPLALVLLDLDHFKSINDTFGHAAGDDVLRGFAEVMRSCVREDDLLGRWGGEEFALALTGPNMREASVIAERIRSACAAATFLKDHPARKVTVSIGIASNLDRSSDGLSLLRRADAALYRAKESGRNRVCVATMSLRP